MERIREVKALKGRAIAEIAIELWCSNPGRQGLMRTLMN
jgi:hypothetical protein